MRGMTPVIERIPGVVLAGGLSRRMGGGDKGMRELGGKPLMLHVIERLSAQASPLAINANGDPSRFAHFGLPVIPDATADFAGPLAGILAGLRWAGQAAPDARFIVTAACDTPFFPEDLVAKFLAAADGAYPAIVLAQSAGQVHPVFGPVALGPGGRFGSRARVRHAQGPAVGRAASALRRGVPHDRPWRQAGRSLLQCEYPGGTRASRRSRPPRGRNPAALTAP